MPISSPTRVKDAFLHSLFSSLFVKWGQSGPIRTNLRASSVLVPTGEWCSREYVLAGAHTDEAEPPEKDSSLAHLNAIFLNGWTIHQKWQRLFKQYANVVREGNEYCLDLTLYHKAYDVYFSPDAILEITGTRYIIEIKGINSDEFQAASDLPLEEAVKVSDTIRKARIQCTLYMHLFGLSDGIVLAEDKNTQRFRIWWFQYDEALITSYLNRLTLLPVERQRYLVEQVLPAPVKCCTSLDSARAKKCPMRTLCFRKRQEEEEQQGDAHEVDASWG